jgi:hypothetical protein
MALSPVQANAVLTAGLQANFSHTYAKSAASSKEMVSKVMDLGQSAGARVTPLGYMESADYPEFWAYGEDIPEGTNQAVSYNVTIRRWAKRIKWFRDDVTDELTHTLKQRATQLGEHYGTLHERVLFQLIQSTVDPALLPNGATMLAPDGAAPFATTAGGVNRFGVANGNLLAGNGVASSADLVRDYYRAIIQFTRMQDTKGQPLHTPGDSDRGILVIYGAANKEVFERAFYGTIQQGIAAGLSNPLKDTAKNFVLWETSRITTDDWFVFLTGDSLKPIGQFEKEGLETTEADWSNSDEARTQDIGYFQAKARYGYVLNAMYQSLQINN